MAWRYEFGPDTGVTTKLVCGKAKLVGEADDAGKYQLELTFSAPNRVL